MNDLRIVLLGIGVLILIINFFINSGNLIKIVSYCYQTNTISEYWNLFFKSSVSGRAVISSLIGFILALIIFIIILPIILIRKNRYGKKILELKENGLLFQYQDLELEKDNIVYISNINQVLNIKMKDIKVTGIIRIDASIIVGEIDAIYKSENKSFEFTVMEKIILNDNKEAIVPILLSIDGKKYPTYFIFNEIHKKQFGKIKNNLYNQGYKNCIYFSTIRI